MTRGISPVTIRAVSVLAGLAAWEIYGRAIHTVIFAYPTQIGKAFFDLARTGELWFYLQGSLVVLALGLGLAIAIGIPLGIVMGRRATVEQAGDDAAIDIGSSVLTYAELEEAADGVAAELNAAGVGRGAKVGVRITSGTTELYTAILGILLAGAAYVPVDADDPDEPQVVVVSVHDV